jgi:hypothetical protein
MLDSLSLATQGYLKNGVNKALTIGTMGLLLITVPIPPKVLQPVTGGGNYTYLVDGNVIPQPFDVFRKKSIIVVTINGKEYRAVVDQPLSINNTRIDVKSIDVNHPIAEVFIIDLKTQELTPLVVVELLEVNNEYTNQVEVEFI